MKKFVLLLIIFSLFIVEVFAQRVTLRNRQPVHVRIIQTITSNSTGYGNVSAIIDSDVRDASGEYILIRQGSPVRISCQNQKARGMGKPGSIDITFVSTTAIDGQAISLYGSNWVSGRSREEGAIACGVILGLLLFPIGALGLCIKGQNATIQSGSVFSGINVYGDYMIQVE